MIHVCLLLTDIPSTPISNHAHPVLSTLRTVVEIGEDA